MEITETKCGNNWILLPPFSRFSILWEIYILSQSSHCFGKNFVKTMILLKKFLKSWFDEIFFRWEFPQLCSFSLKIFREIDLQLYVLQRYCCDEINFTDFFGLKPCIRSKNDILHILHNENHFKPNLQFDDFFAVTEYKAVSREYCDSVIRIQIYTLMLLERPKWK